LRAGPFEGPANSKPPALPEVMTPIFDLSKVFASPDSHIDEGYIVMCNIGEKIIGVKAHSVVGQEEVVMKLLGEFLGNINGVGGALQYVVMAKQNSFLIFLLSFNTMALSEEALILQEPITSH
jgi:hypothetical protein